MKKSYDIISPTSCPKQAKISKIRKWRTPIIGIERSPVCTVNRHFRTPIIAHRQYKWRLFIPLWFFRYECIFSLLLKCLALHPLIHYFWYWCILKIWCKVTEIDTTSEPEDMAKLINGWISKHNIDDGQTAWNLYVNFNLLNGKIVCHFAQNGKFPYICFYKFWFYSMTSMQRTMYQLPWEISVYYISLHRLKRLSLQHNIWQLLYLKATLQYSWMCLIWRNFEKKT